MTAAKTSLTPPVMRNCANQHRDAMSRIKARRVQLQGQIDSVKARSSSAMTMELQRVYETWSTQLDQTLADLDRMANDMDVFANQLEARDSHNTQTIASAGAVHR